MLNPERQQDIALLLCADFFSKLLVSRSHLKRIRWLGGEYSLLCRCKAVVVVGLAATVFGLADWLEAEPLLACVLMGLVAANQG